MSKPVAFLSGAILATAFVLGSAAAYLRHTAHSFSAREQPTQVEALLANEARKAAVPEATRLRSNPVAPSAEAMHEGMAHFADHCAGCHANNGSGDTMLANGMYPRPPDMRLPLTQNKTDGELFSIVENGIRMSGMPGFSTGDARGEQESWKLVLFLRHLPALTQAEVQEMQHLNPRSPSELEEEKQEQDFLNGSSQP